MDVRCEKCQTEYELDEAKLKPGGVTVKCTTCGHMFRVRRRGQTDVGLVRAPSDPATGPTSVRPSASLSPEELDFGGQDGERTWLVQLDDGEIRTCRELGTLQRWIVGNMVSRTCTISRTGKKWKRLGEIPELASYFQIADEARKSRSPLSSSPPPARPGPSGPLDENTRAYPPGFELPSDAAGGQTLRMGSLAPGDGRASRRSSNPGRTAPTTEDEILPPQLLRGQEPAPTPSAALRAAVAEVDPRAVTEIVPGGGPFPGGGSLPGAAASSPGGSSPAGGPSPRGDGRIAPLAWPTAGSPSHGPEGAGPGAPSPYGGSPIAPSPYGGSPVAPSPYGGSPVAPSPYGAAAAAPVAFAERPTGGWAQQGIPSGAPTSGESGPAYGQAQAQPGREAAFVAGGRIRDIKGEYEGGSFVATDRTGGDSDYELPRSRAALWVGIGALVVLGGGAGAIAYVMQGGGAPRAAVPIDAAPTAVAAPAIDAAPATPTPATPTPATAGQLAELDAVLAADRASALEDLLGRLAGAGETDPAVLIARARLENALAQQAIDRAALAATPADGKKLLAAAKAAAGRARGLAERAVPLAPTSGAAILALADARRLAGDGALEIERGLKDARKAGGDAREAARVLALLRVRDGRGRDARLELDKLKAGGPPGDVRVGLRLALLDLAEGRQAEAKAGLDATLTVAADHVVARAAMDKLATTPPPVESSDPMPPEETRPETKPGTKPGTKPDTKPDTKPQGYEGLLARGDKLAESGKCKEAIPFYKDAIDARPAGVEALTGLGFCHLDGKDYASAFAKFRAALGVSPRYQDAMWGLAELYERQGAKERAIEKYREFIAEHPSSRRAESARRQIERLGGGAAAPETPEEPVGDPNPPDPSGDPATP